MLVKLLRTKRALWLGLMHRDLYYVYSEAWRKGVELSRKIFGSSEQIDLYRIPMLSLNTVNITKLLLLTRLVRFDYEQVEKKYQLE